jgi:hypothetical protein
MLIVSIICFAGIAKLVIACADGPDPYTDATFFLNTVNDKPAFVPFYYTSSFAFYTDGYGYEEYGFNDRVPDENIALWKAYTRGKASDADIDSFVYAFGKKDVVNIYDHLQNRAQYAVSGKVADNSFTKWLMKNKDVEALQYLCFAKTCEQYTTPLEAQWDDKTSGYILPGRDANAMGALVDEGQKGYNAAKSGEIKLRYTYQVLRMAFYSGIALMKRDITLIPLKTRTYSN